MRHQADSELKISTFQSLAAAPPNSAISHSASYTIAFECRHTPTRFHAETEYTDQPQGSGLSCARTAPSRPGRTTARAARIDWARRAGKIARKTPGTAQASAP